MITVKPNGGLGNRMRVINSCIFLAKYKRQKKIRLFWSANSVLNAEFNELFEPINQLKQTRFYLPLFYCMLKEKLGINTNGDKKIFTGHQYFTDESVRNQQFNNAYWENTPSSLLFNTCYDFYTVPIESNFYYLFKPQKNIQKKIETIISGFNDYTAGVHIRRTDHVPSKENSSTASFINKMKKMLEEGNIQQFYLSTDDKEVEGELINNFGNKIITIQNKILYRNSKEGIVDAVIDMYCLAHTNLILGSFESTFSQVAAGIRNIPLIISK